MKKLKFIVLGGLASMMLYSCGGSTETQAEESQLTGSITIDGSSTVYPITEAIAEEFRPVGPDVKITVSYSGTGGGFKKFYRGETDINDASRLIKDKEKVACEEAGIEYVQLSVAYDGLAVVVNKDNDWATSMTVEELKKMWEPAAKGVITKWNQIRPEWPDAEIKLYGPGTASGTFDYFTEAIMGESGACRSDYSPNEDDNVLVNGIANDVNAIGFFGLAYYEENANKLNLVGVDGGNGPVTPSLETVKDGSYSPLSRPLFIYVSSEAAKKEAVTEFVKFYLSNVKEIVGDVGYIPLKDEEYKAELSKFEGFVSNLAETATAE